MQEINLVRCHIAQEESPNKMFSPSLRVLFLNIIASGFLLTEQLKIRVLDVITTNASRIDNAKFEEILESLEKNIEQSQTEEQEQSDYSNVFTYQIS